MGLSFWLLILPMGFMTFCILASGLGLTTTNSSGTGPSNQTGCIITPAENQQGLSCVATSTNVTYFCNTGGTTCTLPYNCPGSVPNPTFCVNATTWVLPSGATLKIPLSMLAQLTPIGAQPPGAVTFAAIGANGFTIMIGTATAVILVTGFNFFSTGENAEGIHIAWMTVLILGVWTILSVGAGIGSGTSFFDDLNSFAPLVGTSLFIFLTFLVTMGTIGSVSRNAGGM